MAIWRCSDRQIWAVLEVEILTVPVNYSSKDILRYTFNGNKAKLEF